MIVTVSGERDWKDKQQIFAELDHLFYKHSEIWCATHDPFDPKYLSETDKWTRDEAAAFVLRHGVSGNTDNWANEWGLGRGVTIERFHAEWHPNGGAFSPQAGPIRNREMAQALPRADLWLAFWSGKFKQRGQRKVSGTFDGITAALSAGIEVSIKPPRAA